MSAGGPPTPAPDVLVAVPARDEEDAIETCLASVVTALQVALATGSAARVRVAVAAHRCRDTTAERTRHLLGASGLEHLVVADESSTTVGEVRTALIRAALRTAAPLVPDRTWVLSTDADTVVPADWVTGLLDVAERSGADLVAGFVGLDGWRPTAAAAAAYEEILQAGLTAEGHQHVWAANLAVSAAAFDAAGGFPPVVHGEEHLLAGHVAAAGGLVVGSLSPVVVTSARMPGRAAHGLGDLLRRLSADGEVAEAS